MHVSHVINLPAVQNQRQQAEHPSAMCLISSSDYKSTQQYKNVNVNSRTFTYIPLKSVISSVNLPLGSTGHTIFMSLVMIPFARHTLWSSCVGINRHSEVKSCQLKESTLFHTFMCTGYIVPATYFYRLIHYWWVMWSVSGWILLLLRMLPGTHLRLGQLGTGVGECFPGQFFKNQSSMGIQTHDHWPVDKETSHCATIEHIILATILAQITSYWPLSYHRSHHTGQCPSINYIILATVLA